MYATPQLKFGPISTGWQNHAILPRLVAILDREYDIADLLGLINRGATILEFRLDSFQTLDVGLNFLEQMARIKKLRDCFGLLATIRENDENRHKRLPIFENALDLVDAVDIEYESAQKSDMVKLTRSHNKLALLSTHNFRDMPSRKALQKIVLNAEELGVDIYKIAAQANHAADMQKLLHFIEETSTNIAPIAIAMGANGLLSRVIAPLYGSILSYGYIAQANAPGQLSLDELHADCMRFYPAYAADFKTRVQLS